MADGTWDFVIFPGRFPIPYRQQRGDPQIVCRSIYEGSHTQYTGALAGSPGRHTWLPMNLEGEPGLPPLPRRSIFQGAEEHLPTPVVISPELHSP